LNTKEFSNKHEKKTAKKVRGKTVRNSGAGKFSKGDVRTKHILIDCKTVTKEVKSVSIKLEWLEKIRTQAFSQRLQYSAIAFNYEPNGQNYYVISESMFSLLNEYLESGENFD
jgi:hypothetical protein